MFSQHLAAFLDGSDVDQTGFADLVGVSQSTVSRWLGGRSTPGRKQYGIIADAMGVTRDQVAVWCAQPTVEERLQRLEEQVAEVLEALEPREP